MNNSSSYDYYTGTNTPTLPAISSESQIYKKKHKHTTKTNNNPFQKSLKK